MVVHDCKTNNTYHKELFFSDSLIVRFFTKRKKYFSSWCLFCSFIPSHRAELTHKKMLRLSDGSEHISNSNQPWQSWALCGEPLGSFWLMMNAKIRIYSFHWGNIMAASASSQPFNGSDVVVAFLHRH